MDKKHIYESRKALGLTQEQAAKMLGYGAKSRISEVETGARNASESVLRLLRAYIDGYRPADWPRQSKKQGDKI